MVKSNFERRAGRPSRTHDGQRVVRLARLVGDRYVVLSGSTTLRKRRLGRSVATPNLVDALTDGHTERAVGGVL